MRYFFTFISLLLCAGVSAQSTGQLYNKGQLYVSPGTLMTAESDFINDTTGTYHNDGEVLLKGDFSNFGIAGFSRKGGLTRFEGYKVQKIVGNKQVEYYSVFFKNGHAKYAFLLSDTMDIFGSANFSQGIVDNKNYNGTVIFEENADHVNTSDNSYVEGKVYKNGNNDFVYPVGKDGYYRPVASLLALNGSVHFFGEYYLKNSGLLYDHNSKEADIAFIDDKEYWKLGEKDAQEDSVLVRLKWRDATTSQEILDVAENGSDGYQVVVVHWDSTAHKWVNEGGVKDLATQTVTSDTVTGYDVFALGLLRTWQPCKMVINIVVSPGANGGDAHLQVTYQGDCAGDYQVASVNKLGVKVSDKDNYQPYGIPSTIDFGESQGAAGTDTDGDGDIDKVVIPGVGTWMTDDQGIVTFNPVGNSLPESTSVNYVVRDKYGQASDSVTVNVQYVYNALTARDDKLENQMPGQQVTLNITDNDIPGNGETIAPETVDLIPPASGSCIQQDGSGKCKVVEVHDEGRWNVNDKGDVTFTPESGYTGNPTPVSYTVEDQSGDVSNTATITIIYSNTHEIAGRIFLDDNGMNDGQVNGTALSQDLGLNVVLVDDMGNVYAITSVSISDGSYSFSEIPDGIYMVILTTANLNIGDAAPSASLPTGWENTGEHIGVGAGGDGSPDGEIKNLHVEGAPVGDVNFGIRLASRNFFIPNGFTPNGDGVNDTWKAYGNKVRDIYLMVYNQYGQKIFETRNINEGWDGTYKGKLQPVGVYVYYAEVTFLDGQKVTKKGSITLIR